MKRLLILLAMSLLLVGCGSNKTTDVEADTIPVVSEENEGSMDSYLLSVNDLLVKYDEEYEVFNLEAGTNLYKVIKGIAHDDIDVAKTTSKSLLEVMTDEQQEVYSEFLDEVIELEESYSHLEWGE